MEKPSVKRERYSPWGKIQTEYEIIPGFIHVTTVSHGGIKLDRCLNGKIPEYMRVKGGWYEEDCQWSIPFIILQNNIVNSMTPTMTAYNKTMTTIAKGDHIHTFRNWYWREYERYFNCVLRPGESLCKDDEIWQEANREEYQVISTFGDWHKNVPKGYVAIMCKRGRRNTPHNTEQWFLVPKNLYTGGHFLPEYSYHCVISPLR